MPWRRAIGLPLMWLLAATPLAGLVAGALIDETPEGRWRAGLFPLALAISDPATWACVFNSAVAAAIAGAGSYLLGIPLARLTSRWRFWGRPLLMGGAWIGWLTPPVCAAYGLGLALAAGRGADLRLWLGGALGDRWVGPAMLAFVGLLSGVPLVAAAAHPVFAGVGVAGEDVAIALGATRRQAWRRLFAPAVRRHAAAASASVFAWWLVEPATPLVLGLRDTLGMRLVTLAVDPAPGNGNQLAATALIALATIALAMGAVRLASGEPPRLAARAFDVGERGRNATLLRGITSSLVLAGWIALATVPWWWVAGSFGGSSLPPLDPAWGRAAVRTLIVALAAWPILVGVAWGVAGWGGGLVRLIERVPPIAIGAGILGLIQSIRAVLGPDRGDALLGWIDPRGGEPWALSWALAVAHLPLALRLYREKPGEGAGAWSEMARVLGASRLRAWGMGKIARRSAAGLVLPMALLAHAACAFPAAFVLSPVSTEQVAVGRAVREIRRGEPLDPRVALGMLGLQAAALGIALRAGVTPAPGPRRP